MTVATIATSDNNRSPKTTLALPLDNGCKPQLVRQSIRKPTRSRSRKPAFSCQQRTNSPTFGHLVEVAYSKNTRFIKKSSATPMCSLVQQQQLWSKLQAAFFAPGADSAAMNKLPALSLNERHTICPTSDTSCLALLAPARL